MTLELLGMGTAVPRHFIPQSDAATIVQQINGQTDRQRQFIQDVYLHAGVKQRHSVVLHASDGPLNARQDFFCLPRTPSDRGPTTRQRMEAYESHAAPLAIDAARQAIAAAACDCQQMTHLLTVSCTGFASPGVDLRLIEALELPPQTTRTHIGFMGCHAALNGLRVADVYSKMPDAKILLVCVELCSLHHQYGWSPDQIVANALFSDGAAAVICGAPDSTSQSWRLAANFSTVLPGTSGDMSWNIGDHGFTMTLSRRLPEIIHETLRWWLESQLSACGHNLADIRSWAIHPGGPKIISACEDALGLPTSAGADSREVLAERGNMSSATVLFVLDRLRRRQAELPCVALAFGPGLTIEAALFVE